GLGIDLAADGVTPNDTTDADNGPNELQNFPVLSLVVAGASTRVIGTIQGAANTLLTIDFYVAADSTGLGEGQVYIGSTTVTTDAAGLGAIDATLAYATTVGSSITATATDTAGNTSEFSAAVGAVVEPPIVDTSVATTFNRLEGNSTGAIVLATFTNGDPNALAGTLGASVVWGGAVTGTPTVSVVLAQRTATASYWQVVGNAVFTEPGNYHVKVTVS
ncbi:MAG: hypothetical protein NT069_35915, partial [Planctomycetota bacterium]|nr:hypothetical protein [Planctomycetota bacterium]